MIPQFYALWAINAPLDERRLCGQLDQMRAFGFDGAVFHPRFYPGQPAYLGDEYMALLSRTVLYAKSIGMEFWIYDEDGWPSGTVGGQLLHTHPQDAQQWADLTTELTENAVSLGSFNHAGRQWQVVQRTGQGVDYLNPSLARHFLEMTHERYRAGLDPAAFAHVSTFFSDEPEFGLGHSFDMLSRHGSIPWTSGLPELYEQRYGEPIATALPGIFFPVSGHEESRVRFWELLTDLFCNAFVSPIDAWCRSHGKRLAAHVKGEEHPLFQVPTHGSAQQVFRRLSMPGIDALERDPSNDFFPRQLASAARQFGDGRSMVECFGGAGWGATPEEFRRYLLWLGGHGITDFVVHLWQYRLNSHAIRDWPASIPNHVGWSDAFPQFLRQVKPEMVAAAERAGVDRADTVLVSPHRGVMAAFEPAELLAMNIHDAGTYADSAAGRINDRFMAVVADLQNAGTAYHIADERTFEEAKIEGNLLRIGHCRYRNLLLSPDCRLDTTGKKLVDQFGAGLVTAPTLSFVEDATKIDMPANLRAVHLDWSVTVPPKNRFPLEPTPEDAPEGLPSCHRATFSCEAGVGSIAVSFADAVKQVTVNGQELDARIMDEGAEVVIPASVLLVGQNVVTFQSDFRVGQSQVSPLAWVFGDFRVCGNAPFNTGPNGTVSTASQFVLTTSATTLDRDMTVAGYPFVSDAVAARSVINLPAESSILRFQGVSADAAHIEIDGADYGFIWGPDWQVSLPTPANGGEHELKMTLFPSSFNTFGPHHHSGGDIHIVSPAQFEGKKNFADPPDAPERTSIEAWHLKPLHLPPTVTIEARKKGSPLILNQ